MLISVPAVHRRSTTAHHLHSLSRAHDHCQGGNSLNGAPGERKRGRDSLFAVMNLPVGLSQGMSSSWRQEAKLATCHLQCLVTLFVFHCQCQTSYDALYMLSFSFSPCFFSYSHNHVLALYIDCTPVVAWGNHCDLYLPLLEEHISLFGDDASRVISPIVCLALPYATLMLSLRNYLRCSITCWSFDLSYDLGYLYSTQICSVCVLMEKRLIPVDVSFLPLAHKTSIFRI